MTWKPSALAHYGSWIKSNLEIALNKIEKHNKNISFDKQLCIFKIYFSFNGIVSSDWVERPLTIFTLFASWVHNESNSLQLDNCIITDFAHLFSNFHISAKLAAAINTPQPSWRHIQHTPPCTSVQNHIAALLIAWCFHFRMLCR